MDLPTPTREESLRGDFIVTSPNAQEVYDPPLEARTVRARADMRFADDDHVQWPQPYSELYCHHMAIRTRPRDPANPLSIMWWMPDQSSFIPVQNGLLSGLGKLADDKLESFRSLMLDCASRWNTHWETGGKRADFRALYVAMKHAFVRLQDLATSFKEMMMGVVEFQRYYLELVAGLDYMEIYQPIMNGSAPPAAAVAPVLGVFTMQPSVVQWCWTAGIPVWFIRPRRSLPDDIILRSIQPLLTSAGSSSADPLLVPQRPSGSSGVSMSELEKMGTPLPSSLVQPTSPSSSASMRIPAQHSATAFHPQVPSIGRASSSSNNRFSPYQRSLRTSKTTGGQSSVGGAFKYHDARRGRSKFEEPTRPWVPPAIPVWHEALQSVNTDSVSLVSLQRRSSQDGRFIFPDPSLFCHIKDKEKALRYVFAWLFMRQAWIFRMSHSGSESLLSNQDWRYFFSALTSVAKTPVASSSATTFTGQQKSQLLASHFEKCVDVDGVVVNSMSTLPSPFWRGQPLSTDRPSHTAMQEVLWELYELNFRFELRALDHRAHASFVDDNERDDLVLKCFYSRKDLVASFVVGDLPLLNVGLAARSWSERVPYLCVLQDVMKTWVGEHPADMSIVLHREGGNRESAVLALERALARFYTQSFFNFFGRAASTPHRLPL
ncbi:hypothetical protein JAAARDRAFT_51795 [Jaapia argillacea MUCL 33604]|uniref:Uncharacterized protein n=1 Tax=Jaapia argillacea MUCL 33604 TaxID=933084 RepID=A0A067P3I7_9AGAM|nr:hypothetical protein JAAARDRAFT_51795 [Jaapia argillacea MUCL 33604]